MWLAADENIEKIADCSTNDEQQPTGTISEHSAEEMNDDSAKQAVPYKVASISVEGEGGDQPPPLVVMMYQLTIDGTSQKPGIIGVPRPAE